METSIEEYSSQGPQVAGDLLQRIPGQSVMAELLRSQGLVPPRRFLGRLFGASPLTAETEPWYKGALGEIEVARILTGLGPDYTVLHAVPVGTGDADIDHVVIGPAGVFTLNTKRHSGKNVSVSGGTFMVNGAKQPHIRNSVFEAKRSAKILTRAMGHPVAVTAMIVVVDPSKLTIKTKHDTVIALESGELLRWFKRRPATLAPDELAALLEQARRPELWHQSPSNDGDRQGLMSRFAELHQTVRRASARKAVWGFAGMTVMAASLILGSLALTR
ncbi:nuclease-related domain-containing protein [Arthrobacter sp. GMC3]|uniref:nuclease-related domain-containing protein n=1 Tax=Arthrobacter sp. GMC3 TaxID=2058894 RepID=UPI000CE4A0C4|nr:nuclease-related domain-containing protein [Arthrobacter sp. GMC3]